MNGIWHQEITYEKIIEVNYANNEKLVIIQHYVTINELYEKSVVIKLCNGYCQNINIPTIKYWNTDDTCTIVITTDNLYLYTQHHLKEIIYNNDHNRLNKTYIIKDISAAILEDNLTMTLKCTGMNTFYSPFNHNNNINYQRILEMTNTHSNHLSNTHLIDKYIHSDASNYVKTKLAYIQHKLSYRHDQQLNIYIDRSIKHQKTEFIEAIISMIEKLFFTVENWLSSTKVKFVALLTTLFIIPQYNPELLINIFSDSQTTIDVFNHLKNTNNLNIRDIFRSHIITH